MDTLKDLWASLIAGMRERTTNPLTVAFIISWCLWNYKFVVVLLGDGTTVQRLKAIEEMYPHVRETYMGGALLYPALSALAYVFVYPVIGMGAIWVYRIYQVTTANLVKKAEKARTITPQERDTLVRAHEKERKKLTDETETISAQLTATRATLAATEEQLEKALSTRPMPEASQDPARVSATKPARVRQKHDDDSRVGASVGEGTADLPVLDEDKENILLHLSNYSDAVSLNVIAGNLKMNPTLANSELRELGKAKLVSQDESGFWGLTESGEALAVKLLKEDRNR